MSKQTSLDIKQANNSVSPENGFIRIKGDVDGNLQYILPDGTERAISSPWELPVVNNDVSDPATLTPTAFEHYIVPIGAVNDWAGHDNDIANWTGTTWEFISPEHSWTLYVKSVNKLIAFDGTNWIGTSGANTFATLDDVSFNNTYDDWFVPSKDELQELYNVVHFGGLYVFPTAADYWSSSESGSSSAWKLNFNTGIWQNGYSKSNFYNSIPIREFTSTITYSVGEIGPAGGFIFYKNGDYYLETSTRRYNERWCNTSISSQHIDNTDNLTIGTGRTNSTAMLAYPGYPTGIANHSDTYSVVTTVPSDKDIVVFDGTVWKNVHMGSSGKLANLSDVLFKDVYDDWYIGSIDLMHEMMLFVGVGYNGAGLNSEYFSSTEDSASSVHTIRFGSQTHSTRLKNSTLAHVRAIRDFQAPIATYATGDYGQAGGIIFYINGTTHYEYALQNSRDKVWSNINTLIGTNSAIGTGLSNTEAIVAQAGALDTYAHEVLDFIVYITKDPTEGNYITFNEDLQKWVISEDAIETITASNGLNKSLADIRLGGALNQNTSVSCGNFNFSVSTNSTGITLDEATQVLTLQGLSNVPRLGTSPDGTVPLAIATVDYVQSYASLLAHWTKASNILTPADSLVEGWRVERNFNGYAYCQIRNNDDVGNGAGSVMELKGSGADYTNNVYFGKYGSSYWLPFLAGNAAMLTDQNMIVGTVGNTMQLRFVVGGGYAAPAQAGFFDSNGLNLESLKTTSVHPASYSNVFVDSTTGLLYASTLGATTPIKQTDKFTITASDISNGYVDLSNIPITTEHEFVIYNGVILDDGIGNDYTLTSNRITFDALLTPLLTVGSKLMVKYKY